MPHGPAGHIRSWLHQGCVRAGCVGNLELALKMCHVDTTGLILANGNYQRLWVDGISAVCGGQLVTNTAIDMCAPSNALDSRHGNRLEWCSWGPTNTTAWAAGLKTRQRWVRIGMARGRL